MCRCVDGGRGRETLVYSIDISYHIDSRQSRSVDGRGVGRHYSIDISYHIESRQSRWVDGGVGRTGKDKSTQAVGRVDGAGVTHKWELFLAEGYMRAVTRRGADSHSIQQIVDIPICVVNSHVEPALLTCWGLRNIQIEYPFHNFSLGKNSDL